MPRIRKVSMRAFFIPSVEAEFLRVGIHPETDRIDTQADIRVSVTSYQAADYRDYLFLYRILRRFLLAQRAQDPEAKLPSSSNLYCFQR